jgi:2-succinyl-5-enolpyruvyl-6-hydroxy-3-cyclohexene-1-carboxylate synthase
VILVVAVNHQFHAFFTDKKMNANIQTATLIVHALAQAGLRAVCIAPGSRSTPLVLAFHAHPDIQIYRHLDERSAAFFALGLALEWDEPVALLCTSGTAVANFFPALIEAKLSQVPLLLLTADRPPELRHSGANQTIDQVKIYGDQVLWSVDVALPQADAPEVVLRSLQTLAGRAYATANGLVKGPVHLNFPFRKPLEPVPSEQLEVSSEKLEVSSEKLEVSSEKLEVSSAEPALHHSKFLIHNFERGVLQPTEAQLEWLADLVAGHERGLIVCGPRCPGGAFGEAVSALARQAGYPIMVDPISGLRFGPHLAGTAVLSAYETFLQQEPAWPEPELVLRLGTVPTGKWLNAYLDRIRPAYRLHLRANGIWADDSHRVSHFMQVNETITCHQLAARLEPRPNTTWIEPFVAAETAVWQTIADHIGDPFFDATAVYDLIDMLPDNGRLFIGNSLPIRQVDQFGPAHQKTIRATANRGASGIDGNLSTGLGIAAASRQPTAILVGDVTFYHDLNGLLAASPSSQIDLPPVTIVLLNNGGGHIFRRLPIANFDPPFTDLFVTPHGVDFETAVQAYGLDFIRVNDRVSFQQAIRANLTNPRPTVIEVHTDGANDEQQRQRLMRIVNG